MVMLAQLSSNPCAGACRLLISMGYARVRLAAAIQPLRRCFRRAGGTRGLARGLVRILALGCMAASCGNKPSGETSALVGLSDTVMAISYDCTMIDPSVD